DFDDGWVGADDLRLFVLHAAHERVVHAEGLVAVRVELDLPFPELNEPAVARRAPERARKASGHRMPPEETLPDCSASTFQEVFYACRKPLWGLSGRYRT